MSENSQDNRLQLPEVTVVAVTTKDYGNTITAIHKTLMQIAPAKVILFCDIQFESTAFQCVLIEPFRSVVDYNRYIVKEMGKYIETSHVMIIQHDGYVINADAWDDRFLEYDYIGAPWMYRDGRNVGNGGFSMRTKKLHDLLISDTNIDICSPEDEIICRLYRGYLEKQGIRYAPDDLAHSFSYELHAPKGPTFGFHNYFHPPWKPPVVFVRHMAMGDVIMLEPVMEWYYSNGYRIILKTTEKNYALFKNHYFPIEFYDDVEGTLFNPLTINLDMTYEVTPQQLVLKSFYQFSKVKKGPLRNSRLNIKVDKTRLFKKYIVFHLDHNDMPHRYVHGVDWKRIGEFVRSLGYIAIQVGREDHGVGVKMETMTEAMLSFVIAGADFFIGLDSGPAHIAVACGVKSMIFFGSVNPAYRYADLTNIEVVQNDCQFAGCYHDVISVRGQNCQINTILPPCITHTTTSIITRIKSFVNGKQQ